MQNPTPQQLLRPLAGTALTRLRPLLEPRSIAIVGASDREGSFGRATLMQTLSGADRSRVYPINPRQTEMLGLKCYPSLAELPAPADLVIFAVANPMIEEQVSLAIRTGCKAGTIFASCYLEGDRQPLLTERLREAMTASGFVLCGANCMGFLNPTNGTFASWYECGRLEPGPIGLISHSGTLFITLSANDPRYRYSLVVSPGQELTVTAADYMHYMLDAGHTRVLAMVLETVRDPAGFVTALEKAEAMDIPVVAIKIGRTEESARLAKSHSGAITGDDAAYEALFERHGVLRARNVDELMATAAVMAMPKRAVKGGVAAVLDSGGARGLFLDLAGDLGVPMAKINDATVQKLKDNLEYGLEPVNPVDGWGTGHEYERRFRACLQAVVDDPDAGFGIFLTDTSNDDDPMSGPFGRISMDVAANTHKPVVMATHWSQLKGRRNATQSVQNGIPYLDGTQTALAAIRHAFDYRDFKALPKLAAPKPPPAATVARWRERLSTGAPLEEAESLRLMSDFGVGTIGFEVVDSAEAAVAAAQRIGLPVAVKTAAPGIHHKTEVDGVRLGCAGAEAVRAAYADIAGRLGPQVLVAQMAKPGVELALGQVLDTQFGPIMIVGAGGTLIEVMKDRAVALTPIDTVRARAMIDRLKLRPLLDSHRKRPAADVGKLAATVAAFSVLCATLGDLIDELDINPLIVGSAGAVAVDALVIPRRPATSA